MLLNIYLMVTRVEEGTERVNQLARESTLLSEEENQIQLSWEKLKGKTSPTTKALEDARNEIKKRKARMHEDALAARGESRA
jgi:hypothetical protein